MPLTDGQSNFCAGKNKIGSVSIWIYWEFAGCVQRNKTHFFHNFVCGGLGFCCTHPADCIRLTAWYLLIKLRGFLPDFKFEF